jgi:Zn-dependent peptidase ImmA (M78 family)
MATRPTTQDPEAAAVNLLKAVWSPKLSEAQLPIDPVFVANRLGISVYDAGIDNSVSGMLVKRAGSDPIIYLNAQDSSNRRRFTCAHEIGHYVKRASDNEESFEYVDRRDGRSSWGTDPEERYANSFAASLLIPRDLVVDRHGTFTAGGLAAMFGVSLEAMNNRLRNLGLA